jgi:hypothetical protein
MSSPGLASHPDTVLKMFPSSEAYVATSPNPDDHTEYAEVFSANTTDPRKNISPQDAPTLSVALGTQLSTGGQRQGKLDMNEILTGTTNHIHRNRAESGKNVLTPSASHFVDNSRSLSARNHLLDTSLPEGLSHTASRLRSTRKFASSSLPPSSPPADSTSPSRPHDQAELTSHQHALPTLDESESNDLPSLDMDNSANWPEYWRRQNTNMSVAEFCVGEAYEESVTPSSQLQLPDAVTEENEQTRSRSSDKENQAPSPPEFFTRQLPYADSGDSAYSNHNNFYRDPPSDDSINPKPMRKETYKTVVDNLGSLSRVYRSNIETCKALVNDVHMVEKDAIISRRLWTQEKFHLWRMSMFLGLWNNPALKFHPEAIWKAPIDLEIVGSTYVEPVNYPQPERGQSVQESEGRVELIPVDGRLKATSRTENRENITEVPQVERKSS